MMLLYIQQVVSYSMKIHSKPGKIVSLTGKKTYIETI